MKLLRAKFALIIEEIHNTLDEDATIEDLVLALEENRPHEIIFHSTWGEASWQEAKTIYLALCGYENKQETIH